MTTEPAAESATVQPEDEVVDLCRDLLRIDTTNPGDGTGPGEIEAAAYVVGKLREVGLDPQVHESDPGRTTVSVRIKGVDDTRPGLCVHGHLDVVPANAADWQVDPFGGVERDGCLWGRGAVDMKDMVAMILACARDLARTGTTPPRDLLFVFFADEEAGGVKGSHFMVQEHPEVFEGIGEAISEVGGYSVTLEDRDGNERRAYLLQTAEKGIAWIRLTAHGRAGHGSVPNPDNAIVRLAEAIERIAAHKWPREYIASVRELLDGLAAITGTGWSDEDLEALLAKLGPAAGFVMGTLADTANVTMLDAGYKHNVIPQQAHANVDCRFLPGHEEDLMQTIRDLAGEHVTVEVLHRDIALDAPFSGPLVQAMIAALQSEDPDAEVLPYCLSGGTDNKALSLLGITGYGFAPLRLPKDLDFAPMFHGIDERVPIESLRFGARVLARLLREC
ncbi:MAG TPA: M20/M25/M40 family metallo-hydrolase [Phycicoccus sp.]|nr:M20/M25/M40 family metallo-hydrolase [Phycicoccus sp.]HRA43647.1 M20/M25/M40 family metallo-hydrolase [Phycicoccus sp.]